MRNVLSDMLCRSAREDENFIVLSGDHGYALFDALRHQSPEQFLNVGIAEQGMVGYAAGLARIGFRPLIYGLSSFVPIRVVEQIKLDVCFPNLPVIIVGDGAGVVYSYLGASHQCAEDVSCLRPIPNLRIYSPCDARELEACFKEIQAEKGPCYLRIGKSDRPLVHEGPVEGTEARFTVRSDDRKACLVATGSMVSVATALARRYGVSAVTVPRIKPFGFAIGPEVARYEVVVSLEEMSRYGGLTSSLSEWFSEREGPRPRIVPATLDDRFTSSCGSYQHALSQHGISDEQLDRLVAGLLGRAPASPSLS